MSTLALGKLSTIVFLFFVWPVILISQDWTLRLSSKVEKDGKGLPGALIKLYQGAKVVNQMMSGSDGDFVLEVPPNGDFMLVVSYGDCNAKKFQISTLGVPEEISSDRFRPSFEIGGVTMAKPLYSIDYSLLNQPLVKVAFIESDRKFDHDENHTEQMLQGLGRIREAEKALIAKQQESCKAGDDALKKKDCELAKQHYEKAVSIIPQEPHELYPKEQLKKATDCFTKKQEELDKEKADEAAKVAAAKAAADKAESERLAKQKAEDDKLLAEQTAKEKAEKEKQIKAQEEQAKAAAAATEKEASKKREEELKAKSEADKRAAETLAKEKAEQEKQSKNQEIKAKEESEKAAQEVAKKRDEEVKSKPEQEKAKQQEKTEAAKVKTSQENQVVKKEDKPKQDLQAKSEPKKAEPNSGSENVKSSAPENKQKEAVKKEPVKTDNTVKTEKKTDKIVPAETKEPKRKKKKSKKSSHSIRPRL